MFLIIIIINKHCPVLSLALGELHHLVPVLSDVYRSEKTMLPRIQLN